MAGKVYDLNDLPTDLDGIENMLVEVNAEIADITDQLAEFEGDDEWTARASGARKFRYILRAKLQARLDRLTRANSDPAKAAQVRAESKREAQQLQAQMQRKAAEAKAERIRAANDHERMQFGMVKAWLKDKHPSVWQEAIAFLQSAGE